MSLKRYISDLRRDYQLGGIDEKNTEASPFDQFKKWFDEALQSGILEPNAATLCTIGLDAYPNGRILLLKNFDKNGFVFYTNYQSAKGEELEKNPKAAMVFFWDKLERQVRIVGDIEKISREESKEYFDSRPIKNRIGAWASEQSKPLSSRFRLIRKFLAIASQYPSGNVPLPEFWGGYRLKPKEIEFWQGRQSRLHDRIKYTLLGNDWQKTRLNP